MAKAKSCTGEARRGSCSAASPWWRDGSSSRICTWGLAATTQLPEPSLATPFDKVSTGQQPSLMPSSSFVRATDATSTPSRPTASSRSTNDTHHLAIHSMGPRPRKPSPKSGWWVYPSAGGHRQILKIDRGSTHHEHSLQASCPLRHRHNPLIWDTQHRHHRQWHTVHWQKVLGLL